MNALSLMKFITHHPLNRDHKADAVLRFVKWQINTRINPYPIIYQFTEKSKLIVQKGMAGATQNVYCGLQEFSDMGFLIHLLRKEDFFVDIGANVGSYTVLSAGHIGAKTFSVEPVPTTFAHLLRNIAINQIEETTTAFNVAMGAKKGCVDFTSAFDTKNHVAKAGEKNTIKVPIETLDDILANEPVPILLKIDVEGFEADVVNGATHTLQQPGLKGIIMELNGSGARYGRNENDIHKSLLGYGFGAYRYAPKERKLSAAGTFGSHNTIYIRDIDFVQQRLSTAPTITMLHNEF